MELEVRHLRLVRAVAAFGGLTSAGRELHLTQSALSHQLRDVETRLGTALFLRVGKRMVLTSAGERLLQSAGEILDTLERTEDAIRGLAGGRHGRLRVSTGGYTEYHWLPEVLKAFRISCPHVDLQIVAAANGEAVQLLVDGHLEVGVVDHLVDDARLRACPLFEDEVVVIAAPSHPIAKRRFARPEDFAEQTLFLQTAPETHQVFQRVLAPAHTRFEKIEVIAQTGVLVELVKAGLGVGLIARWAVEPLDRAGVIRAVSLGRDGERHPWNALFLKDLEDDTYVREFIIIMMKVFNRTLKDSMSHNRGSSKG